MEPRGLGFSEAGVVYDEPDAVVGERPLGEMPPERYAELCGIDSVERYELDLDEGAVAA
jgi:hypothetical protein